MKLALPPLETIAPWNRTLYRMLGESGLFDITTETFPQHIIGRRWRHFSYFRLDGRLFALDTWDGDSVVLNLTAAGVFSGPGRPHALVKISRAAYDPTVAAVEAAEGLPIIPWVMFPSDVFPCGAFRWAAGPHTYTSCLAGSNRRRQRPVWVAAAAAAGRYYLEPRVAGDAYVALLRACRWGVCLRGCGDKTRREPEYLSCGMPLALNYTPNYPFPYAPGVHYHLLREPGDLAALPDVDPRPYAAAATELWAGWFAPRPAAALLCRLLAPYR